MKWSEAKHARHQASRGASTVLVQSLLERVDWTIARQSIISSAEIAFVIANKQHGSARAERQALDIEIRRMFEQAQVEQQLPDLVD